MIRSCSWIMDTEEPCGNLCEGRTPFCSSHNRQIRKEAENERKAEEKRQIAFKKALTKLPKKRLKKVSPKREELNKEYKILRLGYLLNHPDCEVKLIGCEGASSEIHHTASGSNKVANLNNVSTWKAACPHCHRILHDKLSAKEARELGLKI